MSEDAKEKWRIKVSSMADTETLLRRDAEKLIYDAAVALGKPGMRALAKEVSDKFQDAGLETYGDMRNADAPYFQADCGMKKFDAVALVKLLAEAPFSEEGASSNSDTVTDPAAVAAAMSQAQASQAMSMAQTVASELAEALARHQESSARALIEAAKRANRSPLPTLELQGGSNPSVKVTKVWLEKVKVVMKDYEGLVALVDSMLKNPRGMTLEDDVAEKVVDPMGAAHSHVMASIHDVYDDMGGGEEEDVGVLLYNIWQAAIGKPKKDAAKDYTDFVDMKAIPAGSSAGLLAGHKRWEEALEETRFSGWCDEGAILDSIEVVFQRFGPQVAIAKRAAEKDGAVVVDKLLKNLRVQVHKAAAGMQEAATKETTAEAKKVDKARQQAVELEKQKKAAARRKAEAAKDSAAAQGIAAPQARRPCESTTPPKGVGMGLGAGSPMWVHRRSTPSCSKMRGIALQRKGSMMQWCRGSRRRCCKVPLIVSLLL